MKAALKFRDSTVTMNRWSYRTGMEEVARRSSQNVVSEAMNAELTVLVVNSSTAMAKEMTMLLTNAIPGCSITFAPSIELASWILARKKVGLVVSSPMLPDGGIARLQFQLSKMSEPPDLVVVGDRSLSQQEITFGSRYRMAAHRSVSAQHAFPRIVRREPPRQVSKIKELGSDIRNDINNPLQEIVTMVFIAKNSGELSNSTASALGAIEGAARSLASVVQGIEQRIHAAVR